MMEIFSHARAFLIREFLSPVNYIAAFIIGAIINTATGHGIFHYLSPYLAPLMVQALTRAFVSFHRRDEALLLRIHGERRDPAFVMDGDGKIIASTGHSHELFKESRITSLHNIFDGEDTKAVLDTAFRSGAEHGMYNGELYSAFFHKWYQVRITPDPLTDHFLVCLEDITQEKALGKSLAAARAFSSEVITYIKEISKAKDIYDRLSRIFLREGYQGVFIARETEAGNLCGYAFKTGNERLMKSEPIGITKSSAAPILASRRSQRIISATKKATETQEAFDKTYPCDARVKEFFRFPIQNFINYHEGEVSIIAFNKKNGIRKYDQSVMETMVNTARSATYLMDMAVANEEKFLQIITGLAAASEYSDELTGQHILRVNAYSCLLAEHLGCDDEFSETIGQVAALHDIGKVAIPDIIKLRRRLTGPETDEMRMHPIYGAQIVEQMTSQATHTDFRLIMARNIALNHHQQWNGNGYPGLMDDQGKRVLLQSRNHQYYSMLRPLAGDEIPIEALIVSLADKYDALRSARQYKPAFSHEKATAILGQDDRTGSRGEDVFGPKIMNLYLKIENQFDEIYTRMQDSHPAD